MLPTDSINSCNGAHHNHGVGGGRPGVHGSHQKLPKDVLEALEDHDLERAMALLRQYEAAGSEASNNFLAKFMKMVFSSLNFNFKVAKPAKKRIKKAENSKQSKINTQMQRGKALVFMIKIPFKMMGKAMQIAGKRILDMSQAAFKHAIKPAAELFAIPFIKSYQLLKGRYDAFLHVADKYAEKIKQKIDDIKNRISEKFERVKEEINELTKPVKTWMTNKLDHFVEKQQWFKEAMGQQIQMVMSTAHVMINIMSYVLIPFTFGGKQLKRGGKFLKKGVDKVKNTFGKAKNWIKGKCKKGYALVEAVLKTIAIAVDRIWMIFYKWLLAVLKKLFAPFRSLILYLKKYLQ